MKLGTMFGEGIGILAEAMWDWAPRVRRKYLVRTCAIRSKRAILALLAAVSALLSWGCQSQGPIASGPLAAATTVRLAPGDTVKLIFSGAAELNQSQKIRMDGKLSLPLVGEVAAAGKTPDQLQRELSGLYKSELENSDIFVTLEISGARVVVSGYVTKPGVLALERPTTVFQAIMEAGGSTEYGTLKRVHLIRVTNGVQQTQVLDLTSALSGQQTRPLYVKDGDVIYVPQSYF